MDLGFVIDGSGSIEHYGKGNFKRCLRFVRDLVNVFTISRKFTRVGIVLYSSRPYKIFGFGRYGNKREILQAISRIRYPRRGTKTGRALRYAQRYLFGRSKRRKVLIVMTDGKSYDNVNGPARSLRRRGVEIFSLGIGKKYNRRQLNMIASSGRNVFTAGFRNLASVVRVIKKKACGKAGRPSSAHVPKVRPAYSRFAFHWLGCYADKARRAIRKKIANFRGKPDPVGKCAALAHRRRYKVFAVEYGGECFSGRLAHRRFNQYGPSNKCRKGKGGPWAMDVYKFGKAGYKPVKRPVGGSAVTWRIHGVGCFKDNKRRAAVGRMVVNLKGVKNAVMRCFRQARKLGYKLFAVQDGGKCFAGPRGHLTYGKYGRSHRCRNGLGGKFAISVYRFSKCGRGGCARPKPPRPFPRPISVPRPAGKVCRARVDLGILIDGSGSIEYYGKGNFRRCLHFVQRIVSSFTIQSAYTRVGVVVFSRRARLIFSFSRYRNKLSLVKAISRIRYPRGGTRTGRALRFVRRRLFSRSRGRKKVLVVMTDGRSQDRVSRPAWQLRRSGVKIFSLGIGKKYNRRQLLQMARNRRHVFVAGFRSLDTVARVIKRRVCGGAGRRSNKRRRKVGRGRFGRRHRKRRRRFGKRRKSRGRLRKLGRKGWLRRHRQKMRRRKRLRKVGRRHKKRRSKMRGLSARNRRKMMKFGRRRKMKKFGRGRKKMAGKWLRHHKMKQASGRGHKTMVRLRKGRGSMRRIGGQRWKMRRIGGRKGRMKGRIRKGSWKMRRVGGRWIKTKGKGGWKMRKVGGRWVKTNGKGRWKMRKVGGRWVKTNGKGGWKMRKVGGRWVKTNVKGGWKIRKVGGRWIKTKGNRGWATRRVGGRWVRVKGKGGRKMLRIGGNWFKMKGRRGSRRILVGRRWLKCKGKGNRRMVRRRGRWFRIKGRRGSRLLRAGVRWQKRKFRKGGLKVVRQKGRGRKVFGRRPRIVRRGRKHRRRRRKIKWRKGRSKRRRRRRRRRRRKGKRSHIEQRAPSPFPAVDMYWAFQVSQNATALDLVRSRLARLEGGASVFESPEMGLVANTQKSEHGWISLGDFKGQCFSDPDQCKHNGLTFMSWMKLHKERKSTSSYILSSGGQTTKARGLALLHMANRYILLLSIKDRQWKVQTATLPRDWFNLAFSWKCNGTLQLFVNGSRVAQATAVAVSRPQDLYTTFVIGRPNNALHPQYRMPLEIQSIALWERSLTETELKEIIQSGTPKRSTSQDGAN